MVGNKGAVAVSFAFGSTNMAFVSCHLAARAERKLKRNQMYQDISRQLNLGKKSKFSSFDLPLRFDHLFWMGDLNYRLDCEYREVLERIKVSDYSGLMKYDQLKSQQTHGNVFYDFKEGEINFPPSYRYKRGSRDDYVYIKYKTTGNVHNVPSYCDRVLLHSLPQLKQTQTGYFCNLAYKASDHAPVIATYQVSTRLQYVSSKNTDTENESDDSLKIRFPILQAKIKTNSPDRFCVKFFSYLLEGTPTSKPAPRVLAEYDDELSGFPVQYGLSKCDVSYWGMGDIPELEPILPNRDYISNDYIFIQVVSHGSEECYGQGILTMQDKVKSDTVQPFSVLLRLHDEVCGELRGKVCLSRNPVLESRSLFSDQLVNPDWSSSMQPSTRNLASPGGRSSGSSSSPRSQHWSNEYNDDVMMRGYTQGFSQS